MHEDLKAEISQLSQRYDRAPESRLFAPLADAYRKDGQIDRAIEVCEDGLGRFPDYASAHVILGKCFYDKGATERSRSEFEKVLDLDEENMVALKFLGDILLAEGKRDEAKGFYDRLLAIDPTNEAVLKTMKGMEEEFHVREIDLEDDKAVKKVEQPREMATMTLAGIYASQGYYDKAMKMYTEILENEPGNDEARKMKDKLESMIDSSEKEREDTFDGEVLTISVDEVGREIVESTSGGGTAGSAPGPGEEPDGHETEREAAGVKDPAEEAVKEGEPEDASTDGSGVEPEGDEAPEGMDHFQQWLRKMKESGEKDSGTEA